MDIGKVIKAKRLQLKKLLEEIDTLEAAQGLLESLGPTNGRRKRRKRGRPRKEGTVVTRKRAKNGRRRRRGARGRRAAKPAPISES